MKKKISKKFYTFFLISLIQSIKKQKCQIHKTSNNLTKSISKSLFPQIDLIKLKTSNNNQPNPKRNSKYLHCKS